MSTADRASRRLGPTLLEDGARFRLWAPSARSAAVALGDRAPVAMALDRDGFGEVELRGARPGDRYQFVIDGALRVPDPASRWQPEGVHGPSELVAPDGYAWRNPGWCGRPWREAILYELHLGAFTPEGTARAAIERLDALAELGVTAIELMPIAAFSGQRGWGYDGVLPYAPHHAYGHPDELKRLVDAAHARGLMVLLDVVYNHLGPDGNYLYVYARPMFTSGATPWGDALAVDGPHRDVIRQFFIDNALYWLTEFRFDGLRLDAVDAIPAGSSPSMLAELGAAVRAALPDRHVHLVLENDANEVSHLVGAFTAQWNDDVHHALHVLLTGERDGYYADYQPPLPFLGRALAEGFAYQGEASAFRRGRRRGEPSLALPPTAFVSYVQNHDQIGNRALGERIDRLAAPAAIDAALAIVLLAPQIPLLFMGEEWRASAPFFYFCDHADAGLAAAVRDGRLAGLTRFAASALEPAVLAAVPDPNAPETLERSRLDWSERAVAAHAERLARVRELLALRAAAIVPRLAGLAAGRFELRDAVLDVRWPCHTRHGPETLGLCLNAGTLPCPLPAPAHARTIYPVSASSTLPVWGVALWVADGR